MQDPLKIRKKPSIWGRGSVQPLKRQSDGSAGSGAGIGGKRRRRVGPVAMDGAIKLSDWLDRAMGGRYADW